MLFKIIGSSLLIISTKFYGLSFLRVKFSPSEPNFIYGLFIPKNLSLGNLCLTSLILTQSSTILYKLTKIAFFYLSSATNITAEDLVASDIDFNQIIPSFLITPGSRSSSVISFKFSQLVMFLQEIKSTFVNL